MVPSFDHETILAVIAAIILVILFIVRKVCYTAGSGHHQHHSDFVKHYKQTSWLQVVILFSFIGYISGVKYTVTVEGRDQHRVFDFYANIVFEQSFGYKRYDSGYIEHYMSMDFFVFGYLELAWHWR
ncbi:unnamed protein product [Symbiodinium sp. CCMP2592]|nr:unnamed protein product [Symbiodinium sp. CCMP2592]